jgi:hypothetical protein
MKKSLPYRINAVTSPENGILRIAFDDGWTSVVDLAELIRSKSALYPLLNAEIFAQAAAGEWGFDVTWDNGGDLTLDSRLVRELAEQQTGGPLAQFEQWIQRNGLSLNTAADALGMTRRMIAYYRTGSHPIPKTVLLACKGWETEHARK